MKQEETETAENTELMTREGNIMFHTIMVAIGDSLSDIISSNVGEDGEDDDVEETELAQLSQNDKPGWVMGTINKMVQQCMERICQRHMKIDELIQLGWEDAADYFHARDKKYSISELRIPALVQLQTDDNAVTPALTTFGEPMECPDMVR
jgi:hypothetical protein